MVWKFATSSGLRVSFGMNSCHVHRDSHITARHNTADQPHRFLHGEVQCLSELGVFILFRATRLDGQFRARALLVVPLHLTRC